MLHNRVTRSGVQMNITTNLGRTPRELNTKPDHFEQNQNNGRYCKFKMDVHHLKNGGEL